MSAYLKVESFLKQYCFKEKPLLLALSGGPDSLCLFYFLLIYRETYGIPIHVAHVDHGWREDSRAEAQSLQELALQHSIPFHLKRLDCTLLEGNLEAACRKERYAFFAALHAEHDFQALLTGHHQGDQAETIFKRIAEGAHWSHWRGLEEERMIQGVRVMRPLLALSKEEILAELDRHERQAFNDQTNQDLHYLRARMREKIFPWLNAAFGKNIEKNFLIIGKETAELTDYFNHRLIPLLNLIQSGPFGIYLDLAFRLPTTLLEIKYLLRLLCAKFGFFASREMIEQAAQALENCQACRAFAMGPSRIWIDRRRIFLMQEGKEMGEWIVRREQMIYHPSLTNTSWKEGWGGGLHAFLPLGEYTLQTQEMSQPTNLAQIKKRWSQCKIPQFLYEAFPLIVQNGAICHEFLTGKAHQSLKSGDSCWKITCIHSEIAAAKEKTRVKVDAEFCI